MNSHSKTSSANRTQLNLHWLESVCCETLPNGKDNPRFTSGIRARLRRGLERPDHESDDLLTGYLARAGWSAEAPLSAHIPYQIACAFLAWHPHSWKIPDGDEKPKRGPNFGDICRIIALNRQKTNENTTTLPTAVNVEGNSFTPRFERILSCRKPVQMIPHLRGVVRLLGQLSSQPSIDFHGFLRNLLWWEHDWADERGPRLRWARAYWRKERALDPDEAASTQA